MHDAFASKTVNVKDAPKDEKIHQPQKVIWKVFVGGKIQDKQREEELNPREEIIGHNIVKTGCWPVRLKDKAGLPTRAFDHTDKCLRECDVYIAEITDVDQYGTFVEIGMCFGIRKPTIIIVDEKRVLCGEVWFALQCSLWRLLKMPQSELKCLNNLFYELPLLNSRWKSIHEYMFHLIQTLSVHSRL